MNFSNTPTPIKAVLFDFSGTLFNDRNIVKNQQIVEYLRLKGIEIDTIEVERLCKQLLDIAGSDTGMQIRYKSDISSQNHRSAWYKIAELVDDAPSGFAEAFYNSLADTTNWSTYDDTEYALKTLKENDIKICVLSNIGWDIKQSFIKEDLLKYIDSFVLSYEHGVEKPMKEIFKIACESIQCNPSEVLMVGDNAISDGGASAYGIASYILPVIESDCHIRGLSRVLALVNRV